MEPIMPNGGAPTRGARCLALGGLACIAAVLALPAVAADGQGPSHGLAMHGEVKYPKGFKHFDYVNPRAPKGGEIRVGAVGTFDSFNPFIIKGNPAGASGLYDTLMESSADEAFSEYGLLAETIETPADRSWVAFTLRAEARWHDGQPVTVEDVIWTFDTLREKGRPFYRLYYQDVTKVEATGPRTVKFTFKNNRNRELPLILGQIPILPKHWWATRKFEESSLEPPLGSGPYKIGKFEPGRFLVMERVPGYWGKDVPVNVGRSNFDAMRTEYFRDATVLLEAFKGGQLDFRTENSAKNWATAYDIPALKEGLLVKDELRHERTSGMQGFIMNQRRPLFRDRRVREALILAFDFEWSNKNLFFGTYSRTRSFFDNSELAARGLPAGEELEVLQRLKGQVPDEVFTQEYNPPTSDGTGRDRRNLKRAADLLKEAGWTVKEGKLVDKDGKPFKFEILLDSPLFERIALPYVQSLKPLGIEAVVRTIDPVQSRRREDTFDFDMVVEVFGQSESPGNEQRDYWGSASADREGGRNKIGLKDPAIDALVELVIAAPDRKSLVERTRALDRVLQWGMWLVPHWHSRVDRVAYWSFFGRPDVVPKRGLVFDAWWIDAQKQAQVRPRQQKAAQ
ncbi:MAG: ABC transporter substrate-binding protein [Alphaproteobacteria bacterium]|nr:ABC transporter substrate-binding protein [Alphaproteobacteria bacterium]